MKGNLYIPQSASSSFPMRTGLLAAWNPKLAGLCSQDSTFKEIRFCPDLRLSKRWQCCVWMSVLSRKKTECSEATGFQLQRKGYSHWERKILGQFDNVPILCGFRLMVQWPCLPLGRIFLFFFLFLL